MIIKKKQINKQTNKWIKINKRAHTHRHSHICIYIYNINTPYRQAPSISNSPPFLEVSRDHQVPATRQVTILHRGRVGAPHSQDHVHQIGEGDVLRGLRLGRHWALWAKKNVRVGDPGQGWSLISIPSVEGFYLKLNMDIWGHTVYTSWDLPNQTCPECLWLLRRPHEVSPCCSTLQTRHTANSPGNLVYVHTTGILLDLNIIQSIYLSSIQIYWISNYIYMYNIINIRVQFSLLPCRNCPHHPAPDRAAASSQTRSNISANTSTSPSENWNCSNMRKKGHPSI